MDHSERLFEAYYAQHVALCNLVSLCNPVLLLREEVPGLDGQVASAQDVNIGLALI